MEKEKDEEKEIPKEKEQNEQNDDVSSSDGDDDDDDAINHISRIPVSQLDYDAVKKDSLIFVAGKRRFGKSTWARYFISKIWEYFADGGYVFTKTKHNYFWQQHFPETRIYPGLDWDVIQSILDEQKEKFQKTIDTGKASLDWVLIVLDDVIASKHDMKYEELLFELAFSGRHYKIMVIICSQDVKGVPPDIRQNVDYVVATYQVQQRQIESLMRDYADFWPNKRVFGKLLRKYTEDHNMFIVNQSEPAYSLDGVFFTDKADLEVEPFKVGDDDFWEESKCNWKKQLRNYANLKRANEKYEKNKEKMVKQRRRRRRHTEEEEEEEMLTTGAYTAMNEDQWEARKEEIKKQYPDSAESVKKSLDIFYGMYRKPEQ